MKTTYFFVCLFAALVLMCIAVLQLPSPLHSFTREDCVRWLEYDIAIHREYLQKPSLANGSTESHQKWMDDFTEVIARIKDEPSKLTKQECVDLLLKAQATHAGWVSTDYNVVKHHWEWYNAYAQIINYLKRET